MGGWEYYETLISADNERSLSLLRVASDSESIMNRRVRVAAQDLP